MINLYGPHARKSAVHDALADFLCRIFSGIEAGRLKAG